MDKLIVLYCIVNNFCQILLPELEKISLPNLGRKK
jgi:hypothetical protein